MNREGVSRGNPCYMGQFPLRHKGFSDVGIVPKIDACAIMNMKGPKCANTPTPAQPPVGRRSDVMSIACGHRLKPCSCFYEKVRADNAARLLTEADPRKRRAIERRIDGAAAAARRLQRLGS